MSSSKKYETGTLSARDIVRLIFKRHAVKTLARLTGRPEPTIKHWLHRHCSDEGTKVLLAAALAEFERIEQEEWTPLRRAFDRMRGNEEDVGENNTAQSGVGNGETLDGAPLAAPDRPMDGRESQIEATKP